MSRPNRYAADRFLVPVAAIFIAIAIPLLQCYFRRFDDNTFTSWRTIFNTLHPTGFFYILVPVALAAFIVVKVRVSFPRVLFLFFACFFTTAFFWGVPELNTVSARYVTQAKHLELYGVFNFFREWGHRIQAWMDLPAVPFLDGLIFRIFGESRIYIQLFTAFVFGMTSVVTYLTGKTLWDDDTGFFGGILLLGIPYLITQTPLMLLDVHTMFFLTLAIYLYIRAVDEGGIKRIAAASGAIFIAFFCKYSVWPMLSILPVISLVYYFRKEGAFRREVLRSTLWIFLFSVVLAGIPVLLMLGVVEGQIKLMMDFLRPSLGRWTETPASIYLFQISPVITIAAVASAILAAWKRDLKYLIIGWLPFLAVFFEIKRVRYILPVFPMLTLMAARGLMELRNSDLRKAIAASVVITSFAVCFFLFLPFLKQWSAVNLKDAGQFLDTLDVNAVEVITVPQKSYPVNPAVSVPLLDLSTQKRIYYHYIPGASTPDEDFHTSRFRDSWEYQNPRYYEKDDVPSEDMAVAVISAGVNDKIPPDVTAAIGRFRHTKSFATYFPFFYNHTLVRIYW